MALQKKEEKRVSARIFGCLSLIMAAVLLVLGVMCWKMGGTVITTTNKSLVEEKISFPPAGSPGFDAMAFPDAQKHAGEQLDDGLKAKAYAEDVLGVQLKIVGAGKTISEVAGMAAADPTNMALQQQQATMFQLSTSKLLMLVGAYGAWSQGKMMQNIGMAAIVGGVALLAVAGVQMARYKQLQ